MFLPRVDSRRFPHPITPYLPNREGWIWEGTSLLSCLGSTQPSLSQLQPGHHCAQASHARHVNTSTMSDHERPRDRNRDNRREPRENHDRGGTPGDRRNRSRSPRRDRGGGGGTRRDNNPRYRSRSPFRGDKARSNGGGRGRDDRPRSPPKGPRSNARPPPGPRTADVFRRDESPPPDTPMADAREKPADMDDDDWDMLCTMGFGGFKTTKNTKVPGNDKNYGVRKEKQMEARQYMNRQGGFNRPLSPGRG